MKERAKAFLGERGELIWEIWDRALFGVFRIGPGSRIRICRYSKIAPEVETEMRLRLEEIVVKGHGSHETVRTAPFFCVSGST